jgi:hypothetical protein
MILLEVYNNIDSAGIDSADEIIRKRIEEYILNKNNNSVGKFKKDYKSIIDSKYRISDLKERQKTKNITEKESYDISSKIRDLHKDISEKEVSTGGFEGWKNASDIYRKELDRYNKAKQALKDLKAKGPPVKSATAHVTWITAVQKIENAIKQIQKNLEGLAWDVKTEKSKIEEAQGESKTKDVDKTKEEQGMVESTKKALLAKINKIQDKNKAEELTRKLESVNTNTTLNDYTENIKPILADINNILKIDSGEKATQEKTEKLRDENIKQDIINLANSENVKNAQKVKVYFESKYGTENIESRVSNKEIPEEEYLQYKKAIEAINNIEKRIRLLQESINKK